jgi:hypothetical protein
MTIEILLLTTMVISAVLAAVHSLAVRGRRDTLWLVVTGVTFGYLFPFIDINLFGHYTFHGQLTVLNFPLHLGFSWFALYYMAFCLGEYLVGHLEKRWLVALVSGLIFGLLEAQWDPTLLHLGIMELFLPTFGDYPWNFNPGVPFCHAYFGFAWVYAYLVFRDTPRFRLALLLGTATLVVWPLGAMVWVPVLEPIYLAGKASFGPGVLVTLDVVHLGISFIVTGIVGAWFLRFLAGRLARPAA